MITRTCTFVGHYSIEWTERFELAIPDDADEVDLYAAQQRASNRLPREVPPDLSDASHEGASWFGQPPPPGPAKAEVVPPWGYLEVPGHGRWLTDGKVAIREGRPLPARSPYQRWVDTSELDAAPLVALLEQVTTVEPPGPYTLPSADVLQKGSSTAAKARRYLEVLDGLEVGYTPTAAVGRDAAGVPQALAMLWEPEPPKPEPVDLDAREIAWRLLGAVGSVLA